MDPIEELLTRGVDTVYPTKEDLEKVLRSGRKIKLYQGFDPTGTDLHIGHMIGLRKLAQWQKLGHHVIFLIGTGTGQAGDPSGKLSAREKFFNEEELKKNARDYVMQAKKLLDFDGENAVEILYNGDWLNKLGLADMLNIAGHFSVQQLIERDMFQERIKKNESINLREFMYPLLQGYDSVAMEVDLELGGSDQMFNMLVGRQLLKQMKDKDKFVMTTPLLADSQGRKIGKTEGNVIGLTDKPEDLFGKIMSLGDDVIVKGFEYLTDVPMTEVKQIENALESGENPMQYKKQLAYEIVKQLNSEADAQRAQEAFENRFQDGDIEKTIELYSVRDFKASILDIVSDLISSSRSESKRLFEQGGVEVNGKKIDLKNAQDNIEEGMIIKAGKLKIIKLSLKE